MTRAHIDWNCKLLSDIHEFHIPPKDTITALTWLEQRFGLNCFCFNPTFRADMDSVASFLAHRESAINALLQSAKDTAHDLASPIKILAGVSVDLSQGLHDTYQLDRLKIPFGTERYLPIKLPMCEYSDWIDLELNRLLYTAKHKLLFLSFEIACILYPREIIEKLLRVPGAIYQFNYSSLANPKTCEIINNLIGKRAIVLFGTSLNVIGKIYHYELDYFLDSAQEEYKDFELAQLMKYSVKFPTKYPKSYRICPLR